MLWLTLILAVCLWAPYGQANTTPVPSDLPPPSGFHCAWEQKPLTVAQPDFNVSLFVRDADEDGDDIVTQQEYHRAFFQLFDFNQNTNISRCEFVMRTTERYGISRRQANALYDELDSDHDDEITNFDNFDVTDADADGDGQTTACELLLYLTHVTSRAEQLEKVIRNKLLSDRERLVREATRRRPDLVGR